MFRRLRIQYPDENAIIHLTVSSIIDRVKYEMDRDKGIRLRVEKLIKTVSNGQT
jgi:hypothetical protein